MSRAAAAETATRYQRTFHGRADQISQVRREVGSYLAGCPAADDAVLIASELAANAVTHSASTGEFFTVRCDAHPDYVWIEVEDLGGPWQLRQPDDRPHGLDLIAALAGPDNWGSDVTRDGDRIVWARLDLPGSSMPGPGRSPDVTGLTPGELERTRRELAASLALARPDSPARVPILAHLAAIDAELAGQSARQPLTARRPPLHRQSLAGGEAGTGMSSPGQGNVGHTPGPGCVAPRREPGSSLVTPDPSHRQ